jgi:hypothetical protein
MGQVSQRPSVVWMADEIFGKPSRSRGIATGLAVRDRSGECIKLYRHAPRSVFSQKRDIASEGSL